MIGQPQIVADLVRAYFQGAVQKQFVGFVGIDAIGAQLFGGDHRHVIRRILAAENAIVKLIGVIGF
jgi:hypothetical protein